jgi:2-polyprenyl-6-methoxyphenol hydroxylase-like FAD-dependent oxidoreductase
VAATEVDVLVAGGGPAGLAAALACARRGLRVLVAEARTWPVVKACGQGLMPTGVQALERLGVTPHIDPVAVAPFSGIRYVSRGGRVAEAGFREGVGWGMRRRDLSAGMVRAARATPGIELREGARVTPLGRDGCGLTARVGGARVRARLLVGADGLGSRVRRWAGLDGQRGRLERFGARRHFARQPWTDRVEVHLDRGAEAYVTPCGRGVTEVALLWDRQQASGLGGGEALFRRLLERFPRLAERLGDAEPLDRVRGSGPFAHRPRAVVARGVALVGDASGYLDAITGEGMSLAFSQALALGEAAAPALSASPSGPPSAGALRGYARAHRRLMRPYLFMTGMALQVMRRPRIAEASVALLARFPGLFQRLLTWNMGHVSCARRRVVAPGPPARHTYRWNRIIAPSDAVTTAPTTCGLTAS